MAAYPQEADTQFVGLSSQRTYNLDSIPIIDQTEKAIQNLQFEHIQEKKTQSCSRIVTESLWTLSTGYSYDPKRCSCCEPDQKIGLVVTASDIIK